jgi:hypothetical protein
MDRFDADGSSAAADVESSHTALLTLHELAGAYDDVGEIPDSARAAIGDALSTLADAPENEASVGLKLDTLVALARADFPDYERSEAAYVQLAAAIGSSHGLDADQVLSDAKAVGKADEAISGTATGAALPHHATAFVGQNVCEIAEVTVDGISAVWVFSEFETDAPFAGVADWVRPESWPKRGPAMFKGMDIVGGGPTEIRGGEHTDHWHAVYLEDVQLFERLKTLLHCDYFLDAARTAGVTYKLDFSVHHRLTVDRGYLLVEDLGAVRRVKALKIVSFANAGWNEVAKLVCPFWTDFVRGAAEGGTATTPHTPGSEAQPPSGPGRNGTLAELWAAWIDFMGDAAAGYASLAGDTTTRMLDDGYARQDLAGDAAAYWSRIAQDWAKAWAYGADMMSAMADKGMVAPQPPGAGDDGGSRFPPFVPPVASPAAASSAASAGVAPRRARAATSPGVVESVMVPVAGLAYGQTVTCSDLVGIEAGGPAIHSNSIAVTVVEIAPQQHAARLAADVSGVAAGLYTGEIVLDNGRRAPVTLYVSQALMAP